MMFDILILCIVFRYAVCHLCARGLFCSFILFVIELNDMSFDVIYISEISKNTAKQCGVSRKTNFPLINNFGACLVRINVDLQ